MGRASEEGWGDAKGASMYSTAQCTVEHFSRARVPLFTQWVFPCAGPPWTNDTAHFPPPPQPTSHPDSSAPVAAYSGLGALRYGIARKARES